MKEVSAESGVKAEAIVFLGYSKYFPHTRQAGFVRLAKVRRRISRRCSREQNPSPVWPSPATKNPDLPRQPRKGEPSTRTVTWPRPPARPQNNCSRGLLYIFPGAGTLRKNTSAN